MAQFTWPPIQTTSGPIQILVDGNPTTIQTDTGTPANTVPMPVALVSGGGVPLDVANDYGASANAIRTAAQIGNATGAADFDDGVIGAQTLRVGIASDQLATLATEATAAAILADTTALAAVDFATEATLAAASAKLPATLGQKTGANSLAVVLASDTVLPNPTGAATLAEQQAQTALLTTIDADTGSIATSTASTVTELQTLNSVDFATETTSAAILADTNALAAVDYATETTLAAASAKLPATLGQKAMAASLAVVLASDQSAIPVDVNAAPSTATFDQITNLTTVAQTFTAPANAVGFKIQAPSTNTQNIVWRVNGTATATAGILMEPGRSEDFDAAGNISVYAVSGSNQVVTVQWKVRP